MPVGFTERRFGLQEFGADIALDDDFGLRRHHQIDSLGLHDIDR